MTAGVYRSTNPRRLSCSPSHAHVQKAAESQLRAGASAAEANRYIQQLTGVGDNGLNRHELLLAADRPWIGVSLAPTRQGCSGASGPQHPVSLLCPALR